MTNQPPGQQNSTKAGENNGNTSRADQPTPISGSSQSQGTQNPTGNKPNQTTPPASGDLKQVGREIADDAKNAVSSATSEVKSQVADVTQAAQEQASHFLGEQKGMAAQRIEGVAHALRQAGQDFADNDESTLAQYTDSLAGQLDRFSNTLRDREIGSLVDDAKQIAYRQPELFVAGALAAGFVLGRFFKSSRRPLSSDQQYDGEYDPRDPSRAYGESYGQSYSQQFNRSGGPEVGRGYRSGYDSGYSSPPSNSQYGQPSSGQYNQGYGQASTQAATQESFQPQSQGYGERSGQEFGQGEEQMKDDPTRVNRSSQQSGAQIPKSRQEDEPQ